jgi:hypothetical protein
MLWKANWQSLLLLDGIFFLSARTFDFPFFKLIVKYFFDLAQFSTVLQNALDLGIAAEADAVFLDLVF